MEKSILAVFMVIGVLVAVFIFWQLTFADGGILREGYNSFARLVNRTTNSSVLTEWELSSTPTASYGSFDMSIRH